MYIYIYHIERMQYLCIHEYAYYITFYEPTESRSFFSFCQTQPFSYSGHDIIQLLLALQQHNRE